MLELRSLRVAHGAVTVVEALSLQLEAGGALALLGPNGAGKTSAVEAVAGLVPVAGGEVLLDGRRISGQPASSVVRAGLALVPQMRELFPAFTVEETLLAARHGAARRGPLPLEDVYALFPRLGERRRQRAGLLSGGEQQMLALGRALVTRPRMLLLDEPSAGLAAGVVRSLLAAIARIRDSGVGILLVEQNLEIARALCPRCLVLAAGRVVWQGAMEEGALRSEVEAAFFR